MGIFSRIGNLFRGFVSLFISGIEEANPEALMEAARLEFRQKTAQYNSALARLAGLSERLKNQIKGKTAKAEELERRIVANHRAGNLELAGSLARELQELRADLEHDAHEMQDTEGAYQANLRNAKVVQKEFETKISGLEKQLDHVKIKEAQAEASAALSSVPFRVGDMGDSLKSVENILSKRYEQAAGKARVAADLVDIVKIQEKETESKALEQSALAEFLASKGMAATTSTPGQAEGESAAKEMGPKSAQASA